MSLSDTLGYVLFGNPVSYAIISAAADLANKLPKKVTPKEVVVPPPVAPMRICELVGRDFIWVRIAGVSGATAVIMGAYGKHSLARIEDVKLQMEAKAIFDTASRFHFLHTVVLLAMPITKRPLVTGSLMAMGTMLFSGTMYYRALTGDKKFLQVATCGGFCLIAAWLSLII